MNTRGRTELALATSDGHGSNGARLCPTPSETRVSNPDKMGFNAEIAFRATNANADHNSMRTVGPTRL